LALHILGELRQRDQGIGDDEARSRNREELIRRIPWMPQAGVCGGLSERAATRPPSDATSSTRSRLPGTCPDRQSGTTMPRTTRTNTTRSSTKARPAGRTRTVAYDVAKQLRTPKEMAAYLEAWLVEAPDDAVGIARALGDIARAVGLSKVAKQSGLSRESLYKALSEDVAVRLGHAVVAFALGSRGGAGHGRPVGRVMAEMMPEGKEPSSS
jgi:probable addiction module antidote protein